MESLDVIVGLIANTRTSKGLTIQAGPNPNSYRKGIKIPEEEEMVRLNVIAHKQE